MVSFEISGKTISVPESWDDITCGQWLNIEKVKDRSDVVAIFSALCDVPYNDLFLADLDEVMPMIERVSFISDTPDFLKIEAPKTVFISGKNIDVPQDIRLKTLGQFQTFQSKVLPHVLVYKDGGISCDFKVMDVAVAIYMQPLITGKKFDAETLEETIKEVRSMPMLECFALANFFLNNLKTQQTTKGKNSDTNPHTKKQPQELIN